MDPATPDWRAFGQPAAATQPAPTTPDGSRSVVAFVTGLPRTTLIALLAASVLVVGGIALALGTPGGGDIALIGADGDPFADPAPGAARSVVDGPAVPLAVELVVDVAGGVARPGLVRLPAGSRIGDAIAAAGGYAPRADLDAAAVAINLAAPLADGTKVLVPELGASAGGASDPGGQTADGGGGGGRVDLNAATQSELEALPGIGPVTAGRILEARGQAPFAAVDELRSRGLVGESTFAKLRDLVTVGS